MKKHNVPRQLHLGRLELNPKHSVIQPDILFNKPIGGGIWSSSLLDDGTSDWVRWAKESSFYQKGSPVPAFVLEIDPRAKVLEIRTERDISELLKKRKYAESEHCGYSRDRMEGFIAWDKVALDYDAVWCDIKDYGTPKEQGECYQYGNNPFLHWCCESMVVFNPEVIKVISEGEIGF